MTKDGIREGFNVLKASPDISCVKFKNNLDINTSNNYSPDKLGQFNISIQSMEDIYWLYSRASFPLG